MPIDGDAPDLSPLEILLADDNPVNAAVAAALLRRLGHRVSLAQDGLAALRAASSQRFDLVLMDVQMPVMDGLAATRAIRRLPGEGCRVPIVAMTAGTDPEEIDACRAAGMDGHVGKPFDPGKLFAILDGLRHGGA